MNIKDWDPRKEALNLENQFKPLLEKNQKICCNKCGKRHFPDEETFVVVYGNITIGVSGGVIGNHFHKDGTLARVSVFCRTEKCFGQIIPYKDYDLSDIM